jgi:hypothetical protein
MTWLLISGKSHILRRWTEDGAATTWCGAITRPTQRDFTREPGALQCIRCQDAKWKGER